MTGAPVDPPAAPVHTLEPVQPILQPDPPATSPNRSVIHLTKSPRPSEALAPKIAAAIEAHRPPSPVDAEPVPVTLLLRPPSKGPRPPKTRRPKEPKRPSPSSLHEFPLMLPIRTGPAPPPLPLALPPEDRRRCVEITQSLIDDIYSFPFRRPMNPADDHSRDYYKVIQRPMDLTTVMKNIETGKYTKTEEWQEDINLIWANALTYNEHTSWYWAAAEKMKKRFAKTIQQWAMSDEERWAARLVYLVNKLDECEKQSDEM
jgi:hypothetical protein